MIFLGGLCGSFASLREARRLSASAAPGSPARDTGGFARRQPVFGSSGNRARHAYLGKWPRDDTGRTSSRLATFRGAAVFAFIAMALVRWWVVRLPR